MPEIAELGPRVAQALLGAMASDGWNAMKAPFIAIWRKYNPSAVDKVDRKLEVDREHVREAGDSPGEDMNNHLLLQWSTRLEDFLEEFPQAAPELQRLIVSSNQISGKGAGASVRITAKADRRGKNYISGTGDVNVTGN
ncbi:hypothetical protein ACLQ22_02870 [Micromonospora sp. DT178]|jgi:hypothetical protein|uniref:hypothetical protein n=1 Tax=Micromonospora sp. DT178 TaxID=3393436 RepID=UPI003CEB4A9D